MLRVSMYWQKAQQYRQITVVFGSGICRSGNEPKFAKILLIAAFPNLTFRITDQSPITGQVLIEQNGHVGKLLVDAGWMFAKETEHMSRLTLSNTNSFAELRRKTRRVVI